MNSNRTGSPQFGTAVVKLFHRSSSADTSRPGAFRPPAFTSGRPGAIASSPSSVRPTGKLSNEMKRAAATFDSMVWKRHLQPGMPAIESGKPRTESQAAQKLFAAVIKDRIPSNGYTRITPAIAASLRAGAEELPALGRELTKRRLVDKDVHAEFLVGSDRAGRALRCLAGDPAGGDLQRYFLPAILRLPQATALSTAPLEASVAVDLAKQMYDGLQGGGFAVRQTPVEHARNSVAAVVAAGLLSREMGEAVVADFTKLVPVGVGMDAGLPIDRVRGHIPRAADPETMPVTIFHQAAPRGKDAPRSKAATSTVVEAPVEHQSHRSRLHGAVRRIAAQLPGHLHLHLHRKRVDTPARPLAGVAPPDAREAEEIRKAQQMRLGGTLNAQLVAGFDVVDRREPEKSVISRSSSMESAARAAWQL